MPEPLHPKLAPDEQARAKFLEDTAELLKRSEFRRWLWHLIEDRGWCWLHSHGVDVESTNAMYFTLGRREIGSLLLQTAQGVADELFKKMLIEAINLKTQREMNHRLAMQQKQT